MKKILILGGTSDAKKIATRLIEQSFAVTYSVAGIVHQPKLKCKILTGGFSKQKTLHGIKEFKDGRDGLAWHLEQQPYSLVIDATHPYALQISSNVVEACEQTNTTLWRYLRTPWEKSTTDNWQELDSLDDIINTLAPYKTPFFTIGNEVFSKANSCLPQQQWIVRSAGIKSAHSPKITEITAIGPFTLEEELKIFKTHNIDVLVAKNSGGDAVSAKLEAAKQLNVPVLLLARPIKPYIPHTFSSLDGLIEKINTDFSY